jgi:hypothetical protein
MIRTPFFLPVFALLAACTGFTEGFGYQKPKQTGIDAEYRTAAASIMGKDVGSMVLENPDNPNPRIRLKPSPGRAPMLGARGTEVLESQNRSGAYIAYPEQMPVTQYFHIVGKADCDDWIFVQPINPKAVRANPNYYISPDFPGDKPTSQCVILFHDKYRDKSDERLADADGVIFDPNTMRIEKDGLFIGSEKVFMNGWAIKFGEPTPADIESQLVKKPFSKIEIAQLKTIAYWIEQNQASQYAPALRKLLPANGKTPWGDVQHAALHALAAIDSTSGADQPYWTILEAGIIKSAWTKDSLIAIYDDFIQMAPYIAANVLACNNEAGTAERMENILLNATRSQHKLASAKALMLMGKKDVVSKHLNAGKLGNLSNKITDMVVGRDFSKFACPYRSNAIAKL